METAKTSRRPHASDFVLDVEGKRKSESSGSGCRCSKVGVAPSPAAAVAESRTFGVVWLVVACLAFPTLAFVSGAYRPPLAYVSGIVFQSPPSTQQRLADGSHDALFYGPSDVPGDKYLGGLLTADGFDEESCLSRFQSTMYRKPSPHRPSPDLLEKLRQYEALHRRCAPHTAAYNRTLPLLKAGFGPAASAVGSSSAPPATDCKYLVWTPYNGLGNNILTMASAFLYSLLTGRVMLIDPGRDLADLFCEPFPGASWLVPPDFPIDDFYVFEKKNNQSYGSMLRRHNISYAVDGSGAAAAPLPSFIYAHVTHDYDDSDKRFFCEPDQAVLSAIPWMVLKSDNYFVPALFLNRRFEPELRRLFPEKEAVFHHLGRYLFHPSNVVWGMITRYYQSYLAKARERLGIQIRVFNHKESPLELVAEQVVNCTLGEHLLPAIDAGRDVAAADRTKTQAVLIASLYSPFFDQIKNLYWEHPAAGGVVVSVHQPSHEEWQKTGRENHDLKVWAEMYLLSFTDVLVTSAWSTFGYIAQGLAGVRPWVLVRPYGAKAPEPACVRDVSMEPCFHSPPWYDCKACKGFTDPGREVPYVIHCMDVPSGIKVVDRTT